MSVIVCTIEVFPTPPSDEHFIFRSWWRIRTYVPTYTRFRITLRRRRPHVPSSRPVRGLSTGAVKAGGHSGGRSKRKGLPRVEKIGPQIAESTWISSPAYHMLLGILDISIGALFDLGEAIWPGVGVVRPEVSVFFFPFLSFLQLLFVFLLSTSKLVCASSFLKF